MTPELTAIKNEFDIMFKAHSEQSLNAICAVASNKEISTLIRSNSEFAYFIESTFIFRNELTSGAPATFFSDVFSVDEASAKVQKYKFLLWNIEFDIDRTEATEIIKTDLGSGILSSSALSSLIEAYAFTPASVKEVLANE